VRKIAKQAQAKIKASSKKDSETGLHPVRLTPA
jgi:hypothetical protein